METITLIIETIVMFWVLFNTKIQYNWRKEYDKQNKNNWIDGQVFKTDLLEMLEKNNYLLNAVKFNTFSETNNYTAKNTVKKYWNK